MTQNWTCPTSDQWDRYILDPKMADRDSFWEHLEQCPPCRFLVEQRKRDFGKLQQVWDESAKSKIIYLSLHTADPDSVVYVKTLLAAQSEEKEIETNAIALSSADQKLLLRVVRDHHSKETWLYLIADKPDLYANVLIKPFGEEKEYLTDEKGRVNLGKIDWPEPDKLAAEVRLPRATFSLKPIKDLYEGDNAVELNSPAGDRIKVTISGEGRHRRLDIQVLSISGLEKTAELKIAVKGTGMVRLIQLKPEHSNKATFEDVEQPEGLEIYLY